MVKPLLNWLPLFKMGTFCTNNTNNVFSKFGPDKPAHCVHCGQVDDLRHRCLVALFSEMFERNMLRHFLLGLVLPEPSQITHLLLAILICWNIGGTCRCFNLLLSDFLCNLFIKVIIFLRMAPVWRSRLWRHGQWLTWTLTRLLLKACSRDFHDPVILQSYLLHNQPCYGHCVFVQLFAFIRIAVCGWRAPSVENPSHSSEAVEAPTSLEANPWCSAATRFCPVGHSQDTLALWLCACRLISGRMVHLGKRKSWRNSVKAYGCAEQVH